MFDFLKGGKATLTVTLDRATKIYAPGETIHANVRVEGVKDLKIQAAKIALVSREEYEYKYETRDSDGDLETRTSKTTDELKVWEKQFLNETTIKANSNQTFEFDIPLPPNALPSVEGGNILNHEWLVKTTLDRKLAGDVEDKQTVYVLAPASNKMLGAGTYGSSNEPGEAELSLRVSNTQFAVGEIIAGEFIIRPQKDFDVTEIRVELERIESVPRDEGNTVQDAQTVKLAGGTKLTRGNEMVMPFQIKVPTSAPITCRTRHGSIEWMLRGVLSRRMRGDTIVEQEIFLYSAPASST